MQCFRVIGTPQESEWPENVSLNWSFFAQHHSVLLESLLPEICEQGRNILQVLLFVVRHVWMCLRIFHMYVYHQCICIIWEQLQTLGKWVPVTLPLDLEGRKCRWWAGMTRGRNAVPKIMNMSMNWEFFLISRPITDWNTKMIYICLFYLKLFGERMNVCGAWRLGCVVQECHQWLFTQ